MTSPDTSEKEKMHDTAAAGGTGSCSRGEEPVRWLDKPGSVKVIWYGLLAICIFLFFADFLYEKHPYFPIENLPNFWGFYGFAGCVFLVLAASALRRILMREEDYYEKRDLFHEEKNFGNSGRDPVHTKEDE